MCIREVRIYRCPALEGFSIHRFKYNNLCAKLSVCPKGLWERRQIYLAYACPACAGSPEVARPKTGGPSSIGPKITSPGYDSLNTPKGNLVDLYIGQWAHYLSLVLATGLSTANRKAMDVYTEDRMKFLDHWMQMKEEEQCKEHSHQYLQCTCLAQIDELGMFAFNPASALRYHTNSRMREFMMGSEHVKDQELVEKMSERTRMMQEYMLRPGVLFREGRARQPPRTKEEVEEIRVHFEALSKKAQADAVAKIAAESPGATSSDDLHEQAIDVCRTLATFMAEDVGLTPQRLNCVLERLVRGACGLVYCHPKLEEVCRQVNTDLKRATIEMARNNAQAWVGIYRRRWEEEESVYNRLEEVVDTITVVVADEEFNNLDDNHRECALCYADYYDNPDQRYKPQSPDLQARVGGVKRASPKPAVFGEGDELPAERGKYFGSFFQKVDDFDAGEIPVRIIGCSHIFGRRCLFNHWASVLPDGPMKCPVCRETAFSVPRRGYFVADHRWGTTGLTA